VISLRLPLLSALIALGAALTVVACSNQGIGQQCNVDNGNVDCDDGLICTSRSQLLGLADICCPATGSNHPACVPGGLSSGQGGGSASSTGGVGGAGGTGGASGSGGAGSTGSVSSGSGGAGGAGGTGGIGGAGGTGGI
jgi:hypothetical protein